MSFSDLSALGVKCRPIDAWPGPMTRDRQRSPFRASWTATVSELSQELRAIRATNVVIQIAVSESDIVIDGTRPKANARASHPGVILSLDSRHGPLRIACDRFTEWQDNVRAIALGMRDLRRLERYGITRRGEQYRGWRQLPEGQTEGLETVEDALVYLACVAGYPGPANDLLASKAKLREVYRLAARKCHPDAGGNDAAFRAVQEAKAILDQHHGGKP